ncbi:MAG: DNA mismatch repair protein MutS [Nitrospirae bacterium GWB2_47_37]|nr:MAG: DNA mismatch repair protein MutS [Nitrospirae bacterium GWA2_46_11]OGW24466.1 MAG: DNA mismatch repair protein MutS [Nitrospirae bacterium GWB2_47_37]
MITKNSLEALEFDRLLGAAAKFAKSEASRNEVLSISPLGSIAEISKRLGLIQEIRLAAQKGMPLRISSFPDIKPLLYKVRPEGAVLDPKELSWIMVFLSAAYSLSDQLKEREDLPLLNELAVDSTQNPEGITGYPDILRILEKSIDSEGAILAGASVALSDLRAKIKKLEGKVRKKLEEIVREEDVAKFLQDDFITQRSGRWVIPVRMDSKGQVQGVVHDVSKSGETAFMEPLIIIGISNELENLIAEAKAEEIRILRNISSMVRAVASGMEAEYQVLVYIDTLNAIAIFSDRLGMGAPQINERNTINIVGARHPLLMLAFQKTDTPKGVVPIDVRLGGDDAVMVITGPNAGGKTIAIKTIGLLLLMAVSGMPVPADASSDFPLVNNLLVDIGDKQSIEDNLSTFSAHVSNIAEILRQADKNTVVLIDELGTGTDPDEGAALSCAVLKEMKQSGALLFATTHLTDIKGFVHKEQGMLNASMEFDERTFTPLYKLRVGEPGQSHAFETAKRYGLPEEIIESAKNILGVRKIELDTLILDLNEKRRQYERETENLKERQAEIKAREQQIQETLLETENRQREIFANAYKDASDIILNTKRQMHELMEDLKKKERDKMKEVLKEAEAVQDAVVQKIKEYDKGDKRIPSIDELKEGDVVFIKSIGYDAPIININPKDKRLRVRVGAMEIEVSLSDVGFKRGVSVQAAYTFVKSERPDESVSSTMNIVGFRVDEALSQIEPFLNHASLAGLSEVTIIHGIGTGALSKAVREYLTGHPLIKSFRKGRQEEGGAGVTIATMS